MEWISTDLMEVKDKKGNKSHYIIFLDRASAFVRAYKLAGTKTKNIISSLEEFVEVYYGSPLLLTPNGGPQFGTANKAIQEWAKQKGINQELSSAYSLQCNGELNLLLNM